MENIWKPVPIELTHGIQMHASSLGEIKNNSGKTVKGHAGAKGKHGKYRTIHINGKTTYFHHMVYWAHSGKSIDALKNGRIIFKQLSDGMVTEDGFYTNRFCDLLFEPFKISFSSTPIPPEKPAIHSVYGPFVYGKWYDVHCFNKKTNTMIDCKDYKICMLDNSATPCIIKNIVRDKIINYTFNSDDYDGQVSLIVDSKAKKYLLTHVMISSIFPLSKPNETVDHINNDPKDHNIINLQWLSRKENAGKTPIKKEHTRIIISAVQYRLPDEIWKPLPINDYTKSIYSISNFGRIENKGGFSYGKYIRGRKYKDVIISLGLPIDGKPQHVHEYVHRLVYMTFHGPIPEGKCVLHDDTAPLMKDGSYRNWACDLRLGTKGENNVEYHEEKRKRLEIAETAEITEI